MSILYGFFNVIFILLLLFDLMLNLNFKNML